MNAALFILFLLIIIHLLYQEVFLHTLRLKLKYDFYGLRDQLRQLRQEQRGKLGNKQYKLLEDMINNSIKYISNFRLGNFIRVIKMVNNDPDIIRKIDQDIVELDKCKLIEFNRILIETTKTTGLAFCVNNAMLLFYMLPIIIMLFLAILVKKGFSKILSKCTDKIKFVLSLPLEIYLEPILIKQYSQYKENV